MARGLSQNKTKVGLKEVIKEMRKQRVTSQNKTKVGLKP